MVRVQEGRGRGVGEGSRLLTQNLIRLDPLLSTVRGD